MSILFLLSSLGAINGSLIGLYLLLRNQNKAANIYLGGLMLALSLRIAKTVYFVFSDEVDFLILQLGLSACTYIGPFFFLYTQSLKKKTHKISSKHIATILSLTGILVLVGSIYPYRSHPEIWNGYIIYGIYTVWTFSTAMGLLNVFLILRPTIMRSVSWSRSHQHLAIVAAGILLINITYQMALFGWYTYLWGSLIFSFGLYFLMGRLWLKARVPINSALDQPLHNSKQKLKELDLLMTTEKPYLNQKLRMEDLMTGTGLSKHSISKLLNQEYKHGFSQYIKEYRIKEAKHLIQTRPELSLEGIGFEAGFSSKSSFFEAFKKVTKCTPTAYRKSLRHPETI